MRRDQHAEERELLKKAMKADPEGMANAFLDLKRRIEELEARLKMNSRNSSKPPGSDGYNRPSPKSQRKKSGRRSGGQKGHPGSTLEKVDSPDKVEAIKLDRCPFTSVELDDSHIVDSVSRQVFDLPPTKLEVTEYRAFVYEVPATGARVRGEFPQGVSSSTQYGFRFHAWLIYLADYQLIPLRRIRRMCQDLFGYAVSEGTIDSARKRCKANLQDFMKTVGERLAEEPVLHADETSMRSASGNLWLHSLSTDKDTLYHIDPKRGKEAIERMGVLEGFGNILVHDFWQAYLSLDCAHASCNSHIGRELTYFEDLGQSWAKELGKLLLAACSDRQSRTPKQWRRSYRKLVGQGYRDNPFDPPPKKKGARGRTAQPKVLNLLDRLNRYEDWVLAFIDDPAIPFTNNQAERDVRMAKVRQKISGCFRSDYGPGLFAAIRSYISTCIKRETPVMDALVSAMRGKAELFA